jgi:hypothetical protein
MEALNAALEAEPFEWTKMDHGRAFLPHMRLAPTDLVGYLRVACCEDN